MQLGAIKSSFVFLLASVLGLLSTAYAALDTSSFVYIECASPDGVRVSRGSGVIVGDDGRILTAKHVAPEGYQCRGARGTGAVAPTRLLIPGRRSAQYDAAILRFVPNTGETFTPTPYIRLTPALQSQAITAYGVPFDGTGQISVRTGTIATTVPNGKGLIETNALTARGMSGGPVIINTNDALIGVIAGAAFDPTTSSPTNYGVLAAQEVATELGLIEHEVGNGATAEVSEVCRDVPTSRVNYNYHDFRVSGEVVYAISGAVRFEKLLARSPSELKIFVNDLNCASEVALSRGNYVVDSICPGPFSATSNVVVYQRAGDNATVYEVQACARGRDVRIDYLQSRN